MGSVGVPGPWCGNLGLGAVWGFLCLPRYSATPALEMGLHGPIKLNLEGEQGGKLRLPPKTKEVLSTKKGAGIIPQHTSAGLCFGVFLHDL